MDYVETKVYFDGSHYIAIPHTTHNRKRKKKPEEEKIAVTTSSVQEMPSNNTVTDIEAQETVQIEETDTPLVETQQQDNPTPQGARLLTRKELFNELFKETFGMTKWERSHYLLQIMLPYFPNETAARSYVQDNIERKERNMSCRRLRLSRKINLQEFNYFVTLTYDDAKHTEETFKHKLRGCLKMMVHRKGWKYIGVWERSPDKHRLHFHGIFYIPEGKMVGELFQVLDYSPIKKKVQNTIQNTYFNEKFGRSQFGAIVTQSDLGEAMMYLIKYLEKDDGKLIYSKGLPQFFISDIAEEDIVCTIGAEDKKLLLFDNFMCYDQGEVMGRVSKETIAKMRKAN